MSKHMPLIAAIVAKARASMPWPEVEVLADGSKRYSGLTEEQINIHIAKVMMEELAAMSLPGEVALGAARGVFEAESEMLGVPGEEAQFVEAGAVYRIAALTGFKAVIRGLAGKA